MSWGKLVENLKEHEGGRGKKSMGGSFFSGLPQRWCLTWKKEEGWRGLGSLWKRGSLGIARGKKLEEERRKPYYSGKFFRAKEQAKRGKPAPSEVPSLVHAYKNKEQVALWPWGCGRIYSCVWVQCQRHKVQGRRKISLERWGRDC